MPRCTLYGAISKDWGRTSDHQEGTFYQALYHRDLQMGYCACACLSSKHLVICLIRIITLCYLTLLNVTRALVLLSKSLVYFLKFLKFLLVFHELMNQYQACLYSLECISHGDSKYGHEMSTFCHFWKFCETLYLPSAHVCRMLIVNYNSSAPEPYPKRFKNLIFSALSFILFYYVYIFIFFYFFFF